jgi:glucose/arabinose dehydrogenase
MDVFKRPPVPAAPVSPPVAPALSCGPEHPAEPAMRIRLLPPLIVLALATGCAPAPQPPGSPLAVVPARVAEYPTERGVLRVTEQVEGLVHPWGLAALPGGGWLVTERPGFLRRIGTDGRVSAPLAGVPEVYVSGQAGLLDVAVSPQFAADSLVYLAYCEPTWRRNLCGTAVGRGRLGDAGLSEFEVVFRQEPKLSAGTHVGARLVFDGAGHLFVTLGENRQAVHAQDLGKLQGKIVRIFPDGTIPADNPFVGRDGARGEIWSWGNRNVQGAALHPVTGVLWATEHGPMGGDELNLIQPGRNYGWPVITDGLDYSGKPVPGATGDRAEGMERPHHAWTPSPALSGLAFCTAEACGAWRGNLFSGALAGTALIRLELDGDRIVHEERLLKERNERIRTVVQGPDGALYLLTDAPQGKLLKLELLPPPAG